MDNNQKLVSRYINELNKRNFSILDELVAEEITIDSTKVTLDQYIQSIESRIEKFPDYQVTILKMVSKNDHVILNWHREATNPKTGEKISEDLTSDYLLLNGKISQVS